MSTKTKAPRTPARPPQPVTTYWIDVNDHLPDVEITVNIHIADTEDDPVWIGYRDVDEDGDIWRLVSGDIVEGVTHWAEMLEAPHL